MSLQIGSSGNPYIEDFSAVNPNGLPLPVGEDNTVVLYVSPWSSASILRDYKSGDSIPVEIAGYALQEEQSIPLGCIQFNLIKPNVTKWGNGLESTYRHHH